MELQHSAKGSTWKNHLYNRKEGKRYFYDNNTTKRQSMEEFTGIENPDLVGLGNSLSKTKPIKSIRDFLHMDDIIWSPNEEDDTVVKRGKERISKIFKKNKDTKLAKGD